MTTTNHERQIMMDLESYVKAVYLHLVIIFQYRDCYVRHLRRYGVDYANPGRFRRVFGFA